MFSQLAGLGQQKETPDLTSMRTQMQNLKTKLFAPLTFSVIIACAATAQAVIVYPNYTVPVSGTTLTARPYLAGVEVANAAISFSFTDTTTGGLISGELYNEVLQEASGTLDFYYQVIQDPSSGGPVGAVRTSGFGTGSTDCDFRLDESGTVAPIEVIRFSGSSEGDLNFVFDDNGVQAGQSSYDMFIKTTAKYYDQNGSTDITGAEVDDNGISSEMATYEPVAVPEPDSLALLVIGLLLRLPRRLRCVV